MSQETNLNVSPYFDDFNPEKNYYKVLFKPGYPVQARELNTMQSIAQYQTEQFGRHIFKEGSVVIPGQLRYENPLYAIQIEPTYNGIPVSLYFNNLLGAKIRGLTSGVSAQIVYLLSSDESERGNYTLYVKYLQGGGENFDQKIFNNNEILVLETPVVYGNTLIQIGEGFCTTLFENASSEGTSVSVANGVYFVRGIFAEVQEQTIILDPYGVTPSYRVGFEVIESIVNSDEDPSLFDNSKGFSNYSAPGADRFKLELKLSKRNIDDLDTSSFVEILRVENGVLRSSNQKTQYSLIRDELAKRTYEESGNYLVKPFNLFVRDSLNDRVLTQGIYYDNQVTESGNNPSEDLMIYQISPGKAYVNGYDVEIISPRLIDVPKTRTTEKSPEINLSYNSGTLLTLNNGYGSPIIGMGTDAVIYLQNSRKGENPNVSVGETIGLARVYDFVPETDYVDQTSRLNLRLFDIKTFTKVGLSTSISGGLSLPAFIKGKNSNATGHLKYAINSLDTELILYDVNGTFLENEQIIINGINDGRLINSVTDYSIEDIKSVYATNSVGLSTFTADLVLSKSFYLLPPGTTFKIDNGVVSSGLNLKVTNSLRVGDIVSYPSPQFEGDPIYNRVTSIGLGGTNFTISGITTVSGVCNGTLPSGSFEVTNMVFSHPSIDSEDSSFLTKLRHDNIAKISLNETEIIQRKSFFVNSFTGSSFTVSIDLNDKDIYFESFDEDRYIISYEDGTIEPMRRDKFLLSTDGKSITFNGLSKNSSSNVEVICTVKNVNPSSKNKKLNKVSKITISNSSLVSSGIGTTTLNDGLTYSRVYGTRVQDEEISLNVPDVVRVLAVFESNNSSPPDIPKLQLSGSNGNSDFIIGEIIVGKTSNSAALVVSKKDIDEIEYVNLNSSQFSVGEVIVGTDSKAESIISNKVCFPKNITQNFELDDGQRDTFYDFSRIVRKSGVEPPTKQVTVIFQNYTIDESDTGEFITANSYNVNDFKNNVPYYDNARLTDFIDIRPRVSPYTLSNKSPFEFDSRNFSSEGQYSQYILAPDENIRMQYEYYVGRIDTVYLKPNGEFEVSQGLPSSNPKISEPLSDALDIGVIYVPPYVYDTKNVKVNMSLHKRYRMQDISLLENRIERVERYTTLSMLESKTENFTIKDAETGLDRFKCGFFVDNFSTNEYLELEDPSFSASVDTTTNTLRPSHYTTSIDLQLGSEVINGFTENFSPNSDQSYISDLGSPNIRKTGDLITLNYNSVLYFEQKIATKTESVTPFLVRYWDGFITLNPPIDNWTDEISTQTTSLVENITESERQIENITPINTVTTETEVFVRRPRFRRGFRRFWWIGRLGRRWVFNRNEVLQNIRREVIRPDNGGDPLPFSDDELRRISRLNFSDFNRLIRDREFNDRLISLDVPREFITSLRNRRRWGRWWWWRGRWRRWTGTTLETTTTTTTSFQSVILPEEITTTESVSETESSRTEVIANLRSRNIEFDARSLKPRTRFYPFFEGIDVGNYIVPKLLEIEMISGKFEIGETVVSDPISSPTKQISFRVCKPNHRTGPFDGSDISNLSLPVSLPIDPNTGQTIPTLPPRVKSNDVYKYNPYTSQIIEEDYSESSTILNVDTRSLQLPEATEYFGQIQKNMRLIGRNSNAVAIIREIRLVSDNEGVVIGSLFIPDPNITENPKWINGQNTFRLIDTPSLNNLNQIFDGSSPNSRVNESSAEAKFSSMGQLNITETNVLTTRNITIVPSVEIQVPVTTTTTTTTATTFRLRATRRRDPLAQSFAVFDQTGVFLTDVEVFFETKDIELPVILQLRTMIAGVPSDEVIPFSEVVLSPEEINLSSDGSVPTRFTFSSPVYLSGPQNSGDRSDNGSSEFVEYCVVLLSQSPNYRVYVSQLGQNDIETGERISSQPTLGSLFKSQNGTTWTPAQLEDLKYRLYRADFVQDKGIVRYFNPKIDYGNDLVTVTGPNQLLPLSKKIIVGLGSDGYDSTGLIPGASLVQGSSTGTLVGLAGSIVSSYVINAGIGYSDGIYTGVQLKSDTGSGIGAIANITVFEEKITNVSIVDGGINYMVGDVLSIPEKQFDLNVGFGGKIGISSISQISNSLVIDEVQGTFISGINSISYVNSSGQQVSTGATIKTVLEDSYYDGLHMKITHVNHCMHSTENYVKISNMRPLESEVSSNLIDSISISDNLLTLDSTNGFEFFEGLPVNEFNPGYILIGEEVVEYITPPTSTTISLSRRGLDSTVSIPYDSGTRVYKYELNGISLRRINKVHNFAEVDIVNHPIDLNHYYIKIDTSNIDFEGNEIGSDRVTNNKLFFRNTGRMGRGGTILSNNIQYEVITPNIGNITPSGTSISCKIKTYTGTSISGTEKSFVNVGFDPVSLNTENYLSSTRLVCSPINEQKFIEDSPGSKSFTMEFDLETTDSRVSPVIDNAMTSVILTSNLINSPTGGVNESADYANDDSVRSLYDDKHNCIYISKPIRLQIPANSIKVILKASHTDVNDIRVLYRLYREDSQDISGAYELFPGYSNYQIGGDGIKRVIDKSKNDGSSDSKILFNSDSSFKDYEYSVDDLPEFNAFSIKIVMSSVDQARVPKLKEIRSIATVKPRV